MSSEAPSGDDTLLARTLGILTRGLLHVPRTVLAVGVALAVLSLVLTAARLGFRTSRLDLLNPKSAYNQRWLAYLDEFGSEDDAVIVVEGTRRDVVTQAIDRVTQSLQRKPESFHSILSKIETSVLRGKALHYLTRANLDRIQQAIDRLQPVIQGRWAQLEISAILRQWNDQAAQVAALPPSPQTQIQIHLLSQQLQRILGGLGDALQGQPHQVPNLVPSLLDAPEHPLAHMPLDPDGYILFDQGQTGLVLVRLKKPSDGQFAQGAHAISVLREIIRDQQTQSPDVAIGLTGLPILEYDEMSTSQSDMILASFISLVGVACLFVAGFGGLRLPIADGLLAAGGNGLVVWIHYARHRASEYFEHLVWRDLDRSGDRFRYSLRGAIYATACDRPAVH